MSGVSLGWEADLFDLMETTRRRWTQANGTPSRPDRVQFCPYYGPAEEEYRRRLYQIQNTPPPAGAKMLLECRAWISAIIDASDDEIIGMMRRNGNDPRRDEQRERFVVAHARLVPSTPSDLLRDVRRLGADVGVTGSGDLQIFNVSKLSEPVIASVRASKPQLVELLATKPDALVI